MEWFELTHQQQLGFGAVQWLRVSYPHPGAASEQNARLMDALEHLRHVMNDLAADRQRSGTAEDELSKFRREHGRQS